MVFDCTNEAQSYCMKLNSFPQNRTSTATTFGEDQIFGMVATFQNSMNADAAISGYCRNHFRCWRRILRQGLN